MISDEVLVRNYLSNVVHEDVQKSEYLSKVDFEKDSIEEIMNAIKGLYNHVVELSRAFSSNFETYVFEEDSISKELAKENLLKDLSVEANLLERLLDYKPVRNLYKEFIQDKSGPKLN